MPSTLITGAAGYIGSHMAHAMADAREPVVFLDDLSNGFRWLLPSQPPFVKGSIGDQRLVRSLIERYQIDTVIHFAGSVVVPESVRDPIAYYKNNTLNSLSLIECAERLGVRNFIFSSTSAVYSDAAPTPTPETAPIAPASPYGWSKFMTEQMLRDVGQLGHLRYAILRYFNACGADPQMRTGQSTVGATHLIKVAVEAAVGKRQELQVFGNDYPTPDGTCIRDYIHVADLVGAHVLALRYLRDGGASDIMNCGYGHGYSVMQVIEAVKKVSGSDFSVKIVGRRPGDRATSIASAERLRSQLGWQPKFDDLDTIISHAIKWEHHLAKSHNKSK